MPAALAHDTVDAGESETRSLADILGGEEGLENPLEDVRFDTSTRIRDLEHHVAPRPQPAGMRRANLDVRCSERERPTLRHCITGVDGQIEQHLLQLTRVCLDER